MALIMMTKESKMERRDFLKTIGLGAIACSLPTLANTTTGSKIVVVGGGFSGRTVAKYLKLWGGADVDVTIIDENSSYISPILSNLILNGQKTISDLTFDYTTTTSTYSVGFINAKVDSIDSTAKTVALSNGTTQSYDKLVLATGIDFNYTNSYDITAVPHAWIAGEQTTILKTKLDTLINGDTFLMSIPKAPYRCPPGPYERACVVADYLKNSRGVDVNVIVLDENSDILVEKDSFGAAFTRYGVDYRASSKILSVDDTTMVVEVDENGTIGTIGATLLNIIPNQKASSIVIASGLADSTNFAPVDLRSYESTITSGIYIVGDSHKSSQPKAGHIANSEAKVCADAILRSLKGIALYQSPKTNSACYSPISSYTATWLSAVYSYDSANNNMILANGGSGSETTANYNNMFNWSGNLFSDTFK